MIKVSDRFYINATPNCYTLQEKTIIKDTESPNFGKELFRDIGYHSSLESCLNSIMKIRLREFIRKEEINSVQELLEELKRIDKSLECFRTV